MLDLLEAVDAFMEDMTLESAQALEALLIDRLPEDPVARDCVVALASFRPGGGDGFHDEEAILPFVAAVERRLDQIGED